MGYWPRWTCDMTQYSQTCVFISFFQRNSVYILFPLTLQGGQRPKNNESIKKSQLPILQYSLSWKQHFKQLYWKNYFLILQDHSTLIINMEHSLWKFLMYVWDLSNVSLLQSQYTVLAVLKIQTQTNIKLKTHQTPGGY